MAPTQSLNHCEFKNIHSEWSLANDEWSSCKVTVNNVNFSNINYGAIWSGNYFYGSSVHMTNIFTSTPQLWHDKMNLLSFNFAEDIAIFIMTQ